MNQHLQQLQVTRSCNDNCLPDTCTIVSRNSAHGLAPYKSAKEGVDTLSSLLAFNHEGAPTSC